MKNKDLIYGVYDCVSIELQFFVVVNSLSEGLKDLTFKLNIQQEKGKTVDINKEIENYKIIYND